MRMLARRGRRSNLPVTFPGCWKSRGWFRAYNRMHERIRSGRPHDVSPPGPRRTYRTAKQRLEAKRATQARYWRRVRRGEGRLRPMLTRGNRCFNCRQPARTRIVREIPRDDGRTRRALVPYCGRC